VARGGRARHDAVVVGAGPNGLAAAIHLAREGWSVLLVEAEATVGGGCRSAELTVPGYIHDVCSAVYPFVAGSPFMSSLPLGRHGLHLLHASAPLAHPLDDGTAVVLERSVDETARGLGPDRGPYGWLMGPPADRWNDLTAGILGPLRPLRHPLLMASFGLHGVRSAVALAEGRFEGPRARALFGGLAAHSILPLDRPLTAAFGLVLGAAAHAVGWPLSRGGSQRIVDAMASYLRSLGGSIATGMRVRALDDLPPTRAVLFDLSPGQVAQIAGSRLPGTYRRRLERFAHGPGVFKLDLALDGPVPWTATECLRAGTVHVGGTLEEIADSASAVAAGEHPERPFVLVAQQSLVDETRAPPGKHTLWAYCHVPPGSTVDMADRIERQIERFAPGFRDRIVARHTMGPAALESYNPNYVGGDIAGGSQAGLQLFARPTLSLVPYATPARDLFICSASSPPGPGVHGMCGYHAARTVLAKVGRDA
jgi:phytoene dehydrogenase-like protein